MVTRGGGIGCGRGVDKVWRVVNDCDETRAQAILSGLHARFRIGTGIPPVPDPGDAPIITP